MHDRSRSARRLGRIPHPRLLAAAVVLLLVLAALHAPAPLRAAAGVPLPADFGSQWVVIAGYNTYTHTAGDPDALDIVRLDAPTSGSRVLAPVAGTLRYVGSDCASVRAADGLTHLLCHFFPLPGLERGMDVGLGQVLAEVAPDGFAGNNGIAHIHYAIHRNGQGQTLPFSGAYALEGFELANTGAWNEHANRAFVSSNRALGAPASTPAPAPVPEDPPPGDPAPDDLTPEDPSPDDPAPDDPTKDGPGPMPDHEQAPDDAQAPGAEIADPLDLATIDPFDPNHLQPGWNLVAWAGGGTVPDAIEEIDRDVGFVLAFDARIQRYRGYSPFLPSVANTLDALEPGQAVWVSVTAASAVDWMRPSDIAPASMRLQSGFNLVAWTGETRDIAAAIEPIVRWVVSVHTWDAQTQSYRVYRPGAAGFLNALAALRTGEGVWIEMQRGVSVNWRQR